MKKRRFGRVRKLPSGRWQARYRDPDGIDRPAPETFESKTDADVWLSLQEAEIVNGDWINPDDGQVLLTDYAATWIAERPRLRPKTVELYRYLVRKHLSRRLGPMAIADIKPGHIRTWRKELIDSGTSEVTAAKAYRLLKTILGTAADDGVIRRNPCRIKGAGTEQSAERRMLTVTQVFALVEVIEPGYGAFVLPGTFASLRWGELCALRRCDIDLETRTIRVERSPTELQKRGLAFGPPKTDAGKRTVAFPALILPAPRWHFNCFAQEDDHGLIFTSTEGTVLRRSNFRRRVWLPALKQAAVPIIHFHDLRHNRNTLTANAGANLRELMLRMGHTSPRAAMIYLHSTDARQREIADALGDLAASELKRAKSKRSGTQRARRRTQAS